MQNYKKNAENEIFLLFFVTLRRKITFIMKKIWLLCTFALFFSACHESLEDRCEREVKEYTRKNCPAKIDQYTTLDSMTFNRGTHTIHYYYTLTGNADKEGVMEAVGAKEVLRKELKNTTSLKQYKDQKFKVAYTYRSEKEPNKILLDVLFTEKDY